MGWTLAEHPVETFKRNTLAAVVVQLRFRPILKITEHYADFQEKLRSRFPGYEAIEVQGIDFNTNPATVRVRQERAHRFLAASGQTIAALDTTAVSIEYQDHRERATLISDFKLVLEALDSFAPVPVRLGLRYVNLVDRGKVSAHLGRDVLWSELLTADFATVPGGLAAIDPATNYLAEVTAPRGRGKMTVKYGLLMTPGQTQQHFRLDTDRFVEEGFSTQEIPALLDQFSTDIFQVFKKAAGPMLLDWMNGEP